MLLALALTLVLVLVLALMLVCGLLERPLLVLNVMLLRPCTMLCSYSCLQSLRPKKCSIQDNSHKAPRDIKVAGLQIYTHHQAYLFAGPCYVFVLMICMIASLL
jgi:ABC-type multidrug transport system permease subunit